MSRKDISKIVLDKQQDTENKNLKFEDFIAGTPPFLRGISSTMYVCNPWKINQKDDYIIISSINDLEKLIDKINFVEKSILIINNNDLIPILSYLIVFAEEKGCLKDLKVTIQNDISTPLLPFSIKIISDIIKYTNNQNLFNFKGFLISNNQLQEDETSQEIELAHSLSYGIELIKKSLETYLDIDTICKNISFSWSIEINHFKEIAKLRASRLLWAKLIKEFNPKNEKSLALYFYCKTSNKSLTKHTPFNNISRILIESMAGIFGGTQALQSGIFDEKSAKPNNFAKQISHNTQNYLQNEIYISKTIDPWAGSYYLEELTEKIYNNSLKLIENLENFPNNTILNNKKHNNIFENNLNKYTDIERDNNTIKKSLKNLTHCIKHNNGNLLHLAVEALKNKVSIYEISNELKSV